LVLLVATGSEGGEDEQTAEKTAEDAERLGRPARLGLSPVP
jgi:hypothetical protein